VSTRPALALPLSTLSLSARAVSALALSTLSLGCTGGLNLFTVADDIELGQQVRDEILGDAATYPVIYEDEAPEAYEHLYRIRDEVLASGEVDYVDRFDWEVYLVDDPETLNAFAAPGGYMFFYTGLIEYLDEEDHFTGVMGHEMAHAANRHSTQQLTKAYGVATMVEVVLGKKPGLLGEIASGLVGLRFSRDDESEADEFSVNYLCETDYAADGAAGFFEKLESEGNVNMPEFLSTHPASANRVADIQAAADDRGCSVDLNEHAQYEAFKASLP
jgi:beta-barrel assembly-enhancing protease